MKIYFSSTLLVFSTLFFFLTTFGATLPHQGRVSVNGTAFDGNASFRFALVDSVGNIVWNHEGLTGDPSSDITLEVIDGFYRCSLGDTSVIGMGALSSTLFDPANPFSLRIWFNDGVNGLQQLGVDQPLHIAPYALSYARTPAEQVSSQFGESIRSQAISSSTTETELINRLSLLADKANSNGQISSETMDSTLLADLNRTRVTTDIADGNITKEKLSSALLDYLKPNLLSSPSLPSEYGGVLYSGQSVNLSIGVDGRFLSYQWQKNGNDLPGETNATLSINEANATLHDGNYTVTASNDFGSVTSNILNLDINTSKVGSPFGDTFYVKSADDMELLWVQPGTFEMGSPLTEDNRSNDETQRNVTISNGFYLGRFEVSQHEYFKIMRKNTDNLSARPSDNIDDTKPVENVSWNDINSTFLPLLNKLESDNGNLPNGWTYALPTEAEWEFSCRAGTSTGFHFGDFSFFDLSNVSNILDQFARVYVNSSKISGSYDSNAWGFYDMHGNIEEWVSDWYADYNTTNLIDPTGPPAGDKKATRGGNYYEHPKYARSAARYKLGIDEKGEKLGFRLALKKAE